MLIRGFVGILMIASVSGCAAMFSQDYDRAELFGPKGMTATNPNGNQLTIQNDYDPRYLLLPRYDTFVTFHYGQASKRMLLKRSYNSLTLLDYLNFWGLYVDDAIGSWHQYDPLFVYLDSTSGVDTTLPATSFWENENRPRLLLAFGLGIPTETYPPNGEIVLHSEYGLGISYRHKIELYYCRTWESTFGEIAAPEYYLPLVGIQSPIIRYYPWNNYYFIEAGPSFIQVTLDSSWWNRGAFSEYANSISEHLDALTAGLGWCGDLSYFDLRYVFGFKPYQFFNLAPQQFREFVLTFGMIFRI